MDSVVEINPFKCRVWELHDRLEGYLTEKTCKFEIESVARHGQLIPVLGRPVQGDPDHNVEIIYGSRRLFVAKLLNLRIRVDLRELSDREAIVAMDIENRHRADISPYERGLSYLRWLRSGQFVSQDEIAQTLKISAAQVSRLVKLARLPTVIVGAFDSPADIRERWGIELVDAWEDRNRRTLIGDRARHIGAQHIRPTPQRIYRRLLAASACSSRKRIRERDEVITDDNGVPLFRVRPQLDAFALLLPRSMVSPDCLNEVKRALTDVLRRERLQAFDVSGNIGTGVRMLEIGPALDAVGPLGAAQASGAVC